MCSYDALLWLPLRRLEPIPAERLLPELELREPELEPERELPEPELPERELPDPEDDPERLLDDRFVELEPEDERPFPERLLLLLFGIVIWIVIFTS